MKQKIVFDAYAILALLENETGAPMGGISYADAFALSLARELGAPLVTGEPEIKVLAKKIEVEIIWLS